MGVRKTVRKKPCALRAVFLKKFLITPSKNLTGGGIDLREMLKELFDLFNKALIEEIDKLIKKES